MYFDFVRVGVAVVCFDSQDGVIFPELAVAFDDVLVDMDDGFHILLNLT